jgi:hypothetical protein
MERRYNAAQETVVKFTKLMPVLKNSGGPHYESDSSSSGGPDARDQLQSTASLQRFIKALPHLETIHLDFIFRRITRLQVAFVLVRVVLLLSKISLELIGKGQIIVKILLFSQLASSNIV